MKCIKFPTVTTYVIIYNDEGLLTTSIVNSYNEICTKNTNTIEEYTDKDEYIERCKELGIDPLIPPSEEN